VASPASAHHDVFHGSSGKAAAANDASATGGVIAEITAK